MRCGSLTDRTKAAACGGRKQDRSDPFQAAAAPLQLRALARRLCTVVNLPQGLGDANRIVTMIAFSNLASLGECASPWT